MPGGGGLGDPLQRDPAAVQRDVAMGYVSKQAARDLYKVVLDAQGAVDLAATKAERV
jgi:N-methylhydantoinase B